MHRRFEQLSSSVIAVSILHGARVILQTHLPCSVLLRRIEDVQIRRRDTNNVHSKREGKGQGNKGQGAYLIS